MSTEWKGTPAEWDAERDRRVEAIRGVVNAFTHEASEIATATMPPRPVEPPCVVTASGWTVTCKNRLFYAINGSEEYRAYERAHYIAARTTATEAEHDAIRALRDGPTARYEVCGWGVTKDGGTRTWGGAHQSLTQAEGSAKREAAHNGGTAHAIYKRVGGA